MREALKIDQLLERFGDRIKTEVELAPYTAARIGGPADYFLVIQTVDELEAAVQALWQDAVPSLILGGGSNMLVGDHGVRGVTLLNRARQVRFQSELENPQVWAESGANFGVIARQAATKGLAGLTWAAGIPGTVGGAVVGNAGAHGGDVAGQLVETQVLLRSQGRAIWSNAAMDFTYRSSRLKQPTEEAVVLDATFALIPSSAAEIQGQQAEYLDHRRRTQPPGASMGSMFKNPPGDFAGRLVEASGLKGRRIGDAGISDLHGNFFMNYGGARAAQVLALIDLARKKVAADHGVELELEIERVGEHGS
jgi:UDP-N-acetylmuramate dehydrogenase